MAATNFTPIILYHTTTASAAPTAGNLNNGELAINITDGKLFYKDNGGTVQVIATKGTGTIGGSNTQVQYNSSGALAGSANFTFNGTTATINTLNLTNALGTAYGGTALTTYTQGDLVYASAANTLAKLGIGANTYILTSTGSVPQWSAPSAVTVATATNLAGGAAGSVPYQSGASTTTFLSIGSAGQVLTSSGSAPQWSNLSSLGVTSLSFGTTGLTPSTATQGAITVAGTLATTNGGTGLTSFTANGVFYASSTSAVGQSANLTFDGTTLVASNLTDSSLTTGRVVYTTTGGNLTDSANLLYSGTDLTVYGITVGRGAGAVSTNTAVGASALAANTSGSENIAIGTEALRFNTTGARNTALAWRALYNNTTGVSNTAVSVALPSNTTGSYNTAVGDQALQLNTTASANTAVGYQAGYSNTTGVNIVALGYGALYSNTTAANNTAVGYNAGRSETTGGSNTFLGLNAGYTQNGGGANTFIGREAGLSVTTGSYNTFVGAWNISGAGSGSAVTTGSKNTILGGFSGNQGGLDIRTASNYIVLSDGDGNPNLASFSQTEWLMRSGQSGGSAYWTLFSNGGGNSTTYNGTLIGANKPNLAGQANATLPSWFIDIGGRAGDGSTRPTSTQDKFSVGRQAPGGTLIGAANVFEVNQNGCVGLNTTAASSGTGITFPSAQSSSSDANTLDDYEEGTWTPVIIQGATGISYSQQAGTYVKIGRFVYARFYLLGNWTGNGATGQVGGLPFVNSGDGTTWTVSGNVAGQGFNTSVGGSPVIPVGVSYLYKVAYSSTGAGDALATGSNIALEGAFVYITAT